MSPRSPRNSPADGKRNGWRFLIWFCAWLALGPVVVIVIAVLLPHWIGEKGTIPMVDAPGVPDARGVCCVEAPTHYFARFSMFIAMCVLLISAVGLIVGAVAGAMTQGGIRGRHT